MLRSYCRGGRGLRGLRNVWEAAEWWCLKVCLAFTVSIAPTLRWVCQKWRVRVFCERAPCWFCACESLLVLSLETVPSLDLDWAVCSLSWGVWSFQGQFVSWQSQKIRCRLMFHPYFGTLCCFPICICCCWTLTAAIWRRLRSAGPEWPCWGSQNICHSLVFAVPDRFPFCGDGRGHCRRWGITDWLVLPLSPLFSTNSQQSQIWSGPCFLKMHRIDAFLSTSLSVSADPGTPQGMFVKISTIVFAGNGRWV